MTAALRITAILVALFWLGPTPGTAGASDVDQTVLVDTYRLEVPTNPNALPGFQGWGMIQYSRSAAGGMHFLASIETNSPNASYWLVFNPEPLVDGERMERTNDYQWWEIRTDAKGIGHAGGFLALAPGTYNFGGAMTADLDQFWARGFTANVPLCFPSEDTPLGPVDVLR
jgi:hypothetical protein